MAPDLSRGKHDLCAGMLGNQSPIILLDMHLTLAYTRGVSLTVVSSSISNIYSEISAPLDSGLLHERLMKLTPAFSSLGDVGADGAPALVAHFNSLLNLLQ